MRVHRPIRAVLAGAVGVLTAAALVTTPPASATSPSPASGTKVAARPALTSHQRTVLRGIAKDTWGFYRKDIDPTTHLPLDNLGPGSARGTYTSAANIGVYLWAVVAAGDMNLISHRTELSLVRSTLREVRTLKRTHGFLYQWYDTSNGAVIRNPGDINCAQETTPSQDNCYFLSAVDNGWYASGLVVARQALPKVHRLASRLLGQMDFSVFYDNRAQVPGCNTNPNLTDDPPTGQMYGGFYVDQGPAGYHNGALYSDPRIAMYMGMGLHQMPGDVWWRTWRTLPPKQCAADPDFSWQGQWPPQGHWAKIKDPQSGKTFNVWEGHYTYPGTHLRYIPTFGGGMFEGLMANDVIPETTWGPHSFGLADERTVAVQIRYATKELSYPVWGMSPSSTADDTGDYGGFGVEGLVLPVGRQLAQCTTCATETTVTPHASFLALATNPQQAMANIHRLQTLYPDVYTRHGGFYDAVNPTTGSVGHRFLVLDQSMIMASIDNALHHRALQRYFAKDPVSWAARTYLSAERMSIG
jgi:Putative glucoamylase